MLFSSKTESDASDTLPGDEPPLESTDPHGITQPDVGPDTSPDSRGEELPELPEVARLPTETAEIASMAEAELDLDLDLDFNLDSQAVATQPLAAGPLTQEALESPAPSTPLVAVGDTVHLDLEAEGADYNGHFDPMSQTMPLRLQTTQRLMSSRVLVVSADIDERMYLRARLALANLVLVDEASTSTQALAAMENRNHVLGIFNLDDPVVDARTLAEQFRALNPTAQVVATASIRNPSRLALASRWKQWRLKRRLSRVGIADLFDKPHEPKKLVALFSKIAHIK